jgi:WD40 repeat protein
MWDTRTGDCVALFSEHDNARVPQLFGSSSVENNNLQNSGMIVASGTALSSGMLSTGLHGNQYTCMHMMESEETLVAGTGNGYVRYWKVLNLSTLLLLEKSQIIKTYAGFLTYHQLDAFIFGNVI